MRNLPNDSYTRFAVTVVRAQSATAISQLILIDMCLLYQLCNNNNNNSNNSNKFDVRRGDSVRRTRILVCIIVNLQAGRVTAGKLSASIFYS